AKKLTRAIRIGACGEWVVDAVWLAGEIAVADAGGGDGCREEVLEVAPESFIVREPERLVPAVILWEHHRPADREAELVVAEGRERCSLSVEKSAGVHRRIAQELENRSVNLVGAGLRDDVDNCAGV